MGGVDVSYLIHLQHVENYHQKNANTEDKLKLYSGQENKQQRAKQSDTVVVTKDEVKVNKTIAALIVNPNNTDNHCQNGTGRCS